MTEQEKVQNYISIISEHGKISKSDKRMVLVSIDSMIKIMPKAKENQEIDESCSDYWVNVKTKFNKAIKELK